MLTQLLGDVEELTLRSWNDSGIIPHFSNPERKENGMTTALESEMGMDRDAVCPELGIEKAGFLRELCGSSRMTYGSPGATIAHGQSGSQNNNLT